MKIGDYVRTEDGEIGTIIECPKELEKNYGMWLWFDNQYEQRPIRREQIDKSSSNIIDLIEENDIVKIEYYAPRYNERVERIFEVEYKDKDWIRFNNSHCELCIFHHQWGVKDGKLKPIIKSILTKEQFENMEYKVGEDNESN